MNALVRGARRGWPPLLPVALVALAVRAAYLVAYAGSPFSGYYRNDQLYYRAWGLAIAGGDLVGGGLAFEQGPLYAYLLGALFRVFGPDAIQVLALQGLAGAATAVLASWCARAVFGDRAGWIAGVSAAVYGPFVFFDVMPMKTFLEPLLVLAALAAALRGVSSGRPRWFAAAGAALGLACLVREVHAVLLVPLLAAALRPESPPEPRRRRALAAIAATAACLAVVAPAALRNGVVAGEPVAVSSAGGQNLYVAFGPFATGAFTLPPFASSFPFQEHDDFREEAMLRSGRRLTRGESSSFWLGETARWVRSAPGRALELAARKAAILFGDYEVPDSENYGVARELIPLLRPLPTFGWYAGAGLLGLLLALRGRGPARLTALFAAALVLEVLLTFNLARYRAGLAGLWLVLAGGWLAAMLRPASGWRETLLRRAAPAAVAAALSAVAFLPPPGIDRERIAAERASFRADLLEGAAFAARLPSLQRALARGGDDPRLLLEAGLALESSGRLPEAVATYERVLRADPGLAPVRFKLADIYARTGRRELAAGHARRLAGALPGDAAAHALLAAVLLRQSIHERDGGRAAALLGEAEASALRAIALQPREGGLRLLRGRILLFAGRDAEAADELRAARALSPGLAEPDRLLGLLRERGLAPRS